MQKIMLEVIEWVEHNPNLLMWKFPDEDKEIKNGAKLTVRESQIAMLLNEGKLADIFHPGLHTLSTKNIPILSTLKGWKYGFDSPFKADVYFFNTQQFIGLRWGTPAPVLMRDPQFQQVRIRAFGVYNIRICDPALFFRNYAGTFPALTISELEAQMRDFIAPKFGEVLSQANIPVIDVAGSTSDLSKRIEPLLKPCFAELGVELMQFTISSVTLPEEISRFYDKITNMNMVQDMDRFQQFNIALATGESGSTLNQGTQQGMMMGMAMNSMQQVRQNQPETAPVPVDDITARLQKLKALFDNGLIDESEYKAKKESLLNSF